MDSHDEMVKRLQADAMAKILQEIADAEAAEMAAKLADPFKKERKQFVRELVRLRETKRISQNQLAAKTGLQQANISRLESGKANPSLTTLLKITKALDANLSLD